MDILKELEESKAVLLLMPGTEYNEISMDIAKQLSSKRVGYITLNKTFPAIQENFEKKGIDTKKFVFVDAISKTIKEIEDSDQCYFVSSPGALTEIAIKISKLLKQDMGYIIFDSLTNLLVYQKKAPVGKFVSNTVAMVQETKSKAIFYAIKVKEHEILIEETSMFVDRVIDMSKG